MVIALSIASAAVTAKIVDAEFVCSQLQIIENSKRSDENRNEVIVRLNHAIDDLSEDRSSGRKIIASQIIARIIDESPSDGPVALLALQTSLVTMPDPESNAAVRSRAMQMERDAVLKALAIRRKLPDFPLDLNRMDLHGASLPKAQFNSSVLYSTNFSGTDLYLSSFQGAKLLEANFSGANLSGANFSDARISRTRFCPGQNSAAPDLALLGPRLRVQASGSRFYGACGQDVSFLGAEVSGAIFDDAVLSFVDYRHAVLYGSSFRQVTIYKADFSNAQLNATSFAQHADQKDNPTSRTNLVDVVFTEADMVGVDLSYARIYQAKFDDTNLMKANFRNADLTKVSFMRSNLTDVDFTNAKLEGAALDGAFVCRTTLPDGSRIEESEDGCARGGKVRFSGPDLNVDTSGETCPPLAPFVEIPPPLECKLESNLFRKF
jgi:uncharacterized protein YjbI with pentapeptide repeats